ncbi:MAG: hypothetical protein N2A99_04615 [Carnobacterium alterfunditum]
MNKVKELRINFRVLRIFLSTLKGGKNLLYPKVKESFFKEICKLPTPSIVYNLEILEETTRYVANELNFITNLRLHFSLKANRNISVNKKIATLVDGADVASIEEFKVAEKSGYKRIFVHSPGFNSQEVSEIYQKDYIFDFNSISQLENCITSIRGKSVGIRLKVDKGFNGQESYGESSRFGINLEDEVQMQKLLHLTQLNKISIENIHIHTGEKNLVDFEKTLLYIEKLVNSNQKLFRELKHVNLGGGLTNIYLIEKRNKEFVNLLMKHASFFKNKNIDLILEPGMLLTLFSGFLTTSVNSRDKECSSEVIDVVLDASRFNLYQWTNTRPIYSTSLNFEKRNYNLYGNSCFELDIFAKGAPMNILSLHDKIVFSSAGAYLSSMYRTLHGLSLPNEYIWTSKEHIQEV